MNRDMNLKSIPIRRRTQKSTRISIMSTGSISSSNTELVDSYEQDILDLLETLADRLVHGSNIAGRILMCYRISVNADKSYKSVVQCTDSVSLLKNALENNCKNKVELVSDVVTIFKWTSKEILTFVTEEIKKAIYKSVRHNTYPIVMWDIVLDQKFHQILQICSDSTSKLGEKLLKCANSIQCCQTQASEEVTDDNDLIVVIELLIRSHDCFTKECNMEGISAILRKSQALTSILLNLKNWHLMYKLLAGIGRYTEMNYIFQILKENDQFESLLGKGYRNDQALKVALLKFLKIHCPKNKKLFEMVALRFTLHSEVAELFESEARELIENLIETSRIEMQNQGLPRVQPFVFLARNDSTNVCLKKAMENFTHAANYHLHGEKVAKAMKSANQAELVALQMALLKNIAVNATTKCVLRIDKLQIQHLITYELSFPHTKLLIESYNYQPDWGAVLFQRCVISSDITYFNEFLRGYPLTNTLVQDLTRRFLSKKITSQPSINAMKEIVSQIKSVQNKYRIASELGFTDVIESLLNNNSALAYLKDTVWKKGFKSLH